MPLISRCVLLTWPRAYLQAWLVDDACDALSSTGRMAIRQIHAHPDGSARREVLLVLDLFGHSLVSGVGSVLFYFKLEDRVCGRSENSLYQLVCLLSVYHSRVIWACALRCRTLRALTDIDLPTNSSPDLN